MKERITALLEQRGEKGATTPFIQSAIGARKTQIKKPLYLLERDGVIRSNGERAESRLYHLVNGSTASEKAQRKPGVAVAPPGQLHAASNASVVLDWLKANPGGGRVQDIAPHINMNNSQVGSAIKPLQKLKAVAWTLSTKSRNAFEYYAIEHAPPGAITEKRLYPSRKTNHEAKQQSSAKQQSNVIQSGPTATAVIDGISALAAENESLRQLLRTINKTITEALEE